MMLHHDDAEMMISELNDVFEFLEHIFFHLFFANTMSTATFPAKFQHGIS